MLELHPILGVSPIIQELEKLDLALMCNPETIKALDNLVNVVIEELEPGESHDLQRAIGTILEKFPSFEREAPQEYQHYQELWLRLQFASFNSLKDDEVEGLLEEHLLFALKNNINLKKFFYIRFVAYEDGLSRGAMRKHYIQLIHGNKEQIGSQDIAIKEEFKMQPPIIKNWLRDYDQFFEAFRLRSGFEQATYISQNSNVKKLDEDEREVLTRLLQVYDFLRFPTVQDDVGIPGVSPRASVDALKKQTSIISKQSAKTPKDYDIEERVELAIGKEKKIFESSLSGDIQKFQNLLFSQLFSISPMSPRPDKVKIIALLYHLAEKARLSDLLSEDNRFKEKFAAFLKEQGHQGDLNNLKINPKDPLVAGHFLKFLLEDRLGLGTDEAAKYGAKLGNLLKKAGKPEYFGMAYYDMGEKRFKWRL